MILPSITANGTRPAALLDALDEAWEALDDAGAKLRNAAPNARDYRDWDEFNQAAAEHRARQQKITEVMRELEAIINHVGKAPK